MENNKPDWTPIIESLGWICDGTAETNDMIKLGDHVWNTYVLPLQQENKALREEKRLFLENAASQLNTNQAAIQHARIWGELNDKLEREITDLQSKLKESEHLKELADDAYLNLKKEIDRLKEDSEAFSKLI